jgi:4,5-DOPA dioxygenase extradiol
MITQKLIARDFEALAQDYFSTPAGRLAVPTPDHYYPLLYVLGAAEPTNPGDALSFEYEGMQNGSISMRAVGFGV